MKKAGGIYPLPQEGAHPAGDGVQRCLTSIYNPVIIFFLLKKSHINIQVFKEIVHFYLLENYLLSNTMRLRCATANPEMLLRYAK